jgi:hypothetical protein
MPAGQKMLTPQFRRPATTSPAPAKSTTKTSTIRPSGTDYLERRGLSATRRPERRQERRLQVRAARLNDNQIMDWHIADYGIERAAGRHDAVLHRLSACTSRTCRGTFRASTTTSSRSRASSCRPTSRTTSPMSRPPACAWRNPEATTQFDAAIRPLEGRHPAPTSRRRLLRHEPRPPARRLRAEPATATTPSSCSGATTAGTSARRTTGANSPSGRSPPAPP